MVTTETEAAPTESTGPTVNIHTTEAAKLKSVYTEPAEGELDCVVMLHRSVSDNSSAVLPTDPVNSEKSVILGSTSSLEPVQHCASVASEAEMPPVATVLGLDESLYECSSLLESAVLTLAAENRNEKVIHEEGEGAVVLEDENYDFRYSLAAAYVRDCEKEENLSLLEKEEHNKEELEEGFLEVLDVELAGLKHDRRQTEVDGRRVQFSNEVQYFKDEQFPTELEDGIEELDEEVDQCSPAEDKGKGNFTDIFKPLAFEKEKYYHAQLDSCEDQGDRSEEEETNARGEAQEKYSDEALYMQLEDDCFGKKVFKGKEHVITSEEEEVIPAEVFEKKIKELHQRSTSPPSVCQSEVTD